MALYLNDLTANHNDLTNTGTTPEWVTDYPFPACLGAVEFADVNGQSLNAINSASLNISGSITIEFWAKRDTCPNVSSYWLCKLTTTPVIDYAIYEYNNEGKWNFMYNPDGGGSHYHTYTTTSTYTDTGWHHWAWTFTYGTGGSMVCYYDGSPVAGTWTSGDGSGAAGLNTEPLVIGNYTTTGTSFQIDGKMAEIRIWNDIRTASEIADNKSVLLTGNEANLVAYYPLHEYPPTVTTNYNSNYRRGGSTI